MASILPLINNLIGNAGGSINPNQLLSGLSGGNNTNGLAQLFGNLGGGSWGQTQQDPMQMLSGLDPNMLQQLLGSLGGQTQGFGGYQQSYGLDTSYQDQLRFAAENQRAMSKLNDYNRFKSSINTSIFGSGVSSLMGGANSMAYAQAPQYGMNSWSGGYQQPQMGYGMQQGYGFGMPQGQGFGTYNYQQPQMGYGMQQSYGFGMPQQGFGGYQQNTNDLIGNLTGLPTSLLGIDQNSALNALNFGTSLAMSNSAFGMGNPTVRKLLGLG